MTKKTKADQSFISEAEEAATKTLDGVQKVIVVAEKEVDKVAEPIRRTVFSRFPVLFLLLVTFGITATLVGMEQLILMSDFLRLHPTVIFVTGIATLVLTGTVYKKLG